MYVLWSSDGITTRLCVDKIIQLKRRIVGEIEDNGRSKVLGRAAGGGKQDTS